MSLTRRGFLTLVGAGGAAAAATGLPGCAPDNGPAPSITVPGPDADGNLIFTLSEFPALNQVGGAVIVHAQGLDPILVVRTDDGAGLPTVAALSATCTHQGCPLGYQAPDVVCPCHQSRFDTSGAVLKSPARAPLETFKASVDAGNRVILELATFPPVVAGVVTLLFSQYPALQAQGGSASGRPPGFTDPILVMALAGGAFSAINARCPHQGCTVGFPQSGAGQVICPCHGSRFTSAGVLVEGPATVGLPAYPVAAVPGGVAVTLPV